MRQSLLILFFLFFFVEPGLSQYNSWIITLATGDTLSGCSLIALGGDSLQAVWSGFPVTLPVESLRKLQYHRRSEFWRGAFYGFAIGAMGGTFMEGAGVGSASSTISEGALGAFSGCLVGGLAAEYLSRDDRYDLVDYDIPGKKNIISALLLQPELHSGVERPR